MVPRQSLDAAAVDFGHAIGMLVRRIRAAGASHELSLTQAAVVARLATEGTTTTAELARAEGVKPQSMRATLAALEAAGLVRRRAHPTDGRQVNIELSPKGEALRKKAKDAKRSWLARAIADLDEEERKTLFASGEIIKRLAQP